MPILITALQLVQYLVQLRQERHSLLKSAAPQTKQMQMKTLPTQSKYFFRCGTTDKITELINKAFGNIRTYFISFQENTYQVGVATEEMSVNIRSVKENRLITSGRAEKQRKIILAQTLNKQLNMKHNAKKQALR